MSINKNLASGLALVVFGGLALGVLIPFGIQKPLSVEHRALAPSFWPNIVASAILLIGIALTVSTLLNRRGEQASDSSQHSEADAGSGWLAFRPFLALAICFALYFGLEPLGFVLASAIAIVALMMLAGEYRPYVILPVALVLPLGLHLFFTKAASVPIPMGILEPWLLRI